MNQEELNQKLGQAFNKTELLLASMVHGSHPQTFELREKNFNLFQRWVALTETKDRRDYDFTALCEILLGVGYYANVERLQKEQKK